jgi:hypothetical protein
MTASSQTALGVEVGAALRRLRDGRALNADGRARLVDLLGRVLVELSGRPAPRRVAEDPVAVVEAAVMVARDSGLTGMELVAAFNQAVERGIGPAPRR